MQSLERKLDFLTRQANFISQQLVQQAQVLASIVAKLDAGSDEDALVQATQKLHQSAESLRQSIESAMPAEKPPSN